MSPCTRSECEHARWGALLAAVLVDDGHVLDPVPVVAEPCTEVLNGDFHFSQLICSTLAMAQHPMTATMAVALQHWCGSQRKRVM